MYASVVPLAGAEPPLVAASLIFSQEVVVALAAA